jgi:uncharacterized protein (DUF2249 family)
MTLPAEVVLASTRQDADAVETVRRHHAELAGGLTARVEALLASAENTGHGDVAAATDDLVAFCRHELIPHALAEETTLYRAAAEFPALRLLVAVMASEHAETLALVEEISTARCGVRAAAAARALAGILQPHLTAENEAVLPRLAAAPDICLTDLLRDMHANFTHRRAAGGGQTVGGVTSSDHAPDGATSTGGCSCGGTDEQLLELDVRAIPHAIRHATVFGAFDAIPSGGSLVLVAPHDPLPLLRQLSQRAGGQVHVTYLERGPQAWRLQLTR